jgi:hypothetical protein
MFVCQNVGTATQTKVICLLLPSLLAEQLQFNEIFFKTEVSVLANLLFLLPLYGSGRCGRGFTKTRSMDT